MKKNILSLDKKILAIYLILFILNLILWVFLISYDPADSIKINFKDISTYFTIASVIIIFGFISSRLPKLRSMGDSSLYEIGYLLIMGLLSISVSYFNGLVNNIFILAPYIDMFSILAIVLIFMIIATRFKSIKAVISGNPTQRQTVIALVVFIVLGISSTLMTQDMGIGSSNVRSMTLMIAGLFGGPVIGIPTALIAAALRFSIGGTTAVPCALSAVFCGLISSLIYLWNEREVLSSFQSALLMFLFIGFEMLLIYLIVPADTAFNVIINIYGPMTFVSVIGIILFKLLISEIVQKYENRPVDLEDEIKSLKESLKNQEERIKVLQEELENKKSEE